MTGEANVPHVLALDEKCVGLLIPPSVGSVVTNAALSMAGVRMSRSQYGACSSS